MSNYYITSNELYHHGILGQKWGVRRYQNPDGSLTAAGKNRYKGSYSMDSYNPKNRSDYTRYFKESRSYHNEERRLNNEVLSKKQSGKKLTAEENERLKKIYSSDHSAQVEEFYNSKLGKEFMSQKGVQNAYTERNKRLNSRGDELETIYNPKFEQDMKKEIERFLGDEANKTIEEYTNARGNQVTINTGKMIMKMVEESDISQTPLHEFHDDRAWLYWH